VLVPPVPGITKILDSLSLAAAAPVEKFAGALAIAVQEFPVIE